ncbi:serine hydrolase domain-containing protein [Tenacibaculum sp. TC6]|uniref:serine hydrolase domain-containing protein n=1 Tax=Tenacibaculum sp. TC6 TaxID=3423223 RepID=UPI003D35D326
MMKETGIPSISITLIKEDTIIWSEAFGYSNSKHQIPATTATLYSTGSTAKPFLGVAILQLVEKGVLDLDAPVNNYLPTPIPSFSKNSKPITLRHLLSHQSGIPGSAHFIPLWGNEHRKTLKEIASEIKPVRKPEQSYEYSNDSFSVAALAIEEQTGMSYGEYINTYILSPLELSAVNFTQPNAKMVEEIALPYKLVYNKALPIKQLYSQSFPAGGNTYLSPTQMSAFLIALLNNGVYKNKRILTTKSIQELKHTSFGHEYYGLGIGLETENSKKYWFHNGLQEGYTASFKLNIASKTGVYLMANTTVEEPLNKLTQLATELLEGKTQYTAIPSFATQQYIPINIPAKELAMIIGVYTIDGTEFNLEIKERNNKIYLINPAKVTFEIAPYSKNKFYLITENEQLEFKLGKNAIESLILYSKNQQIIAHKIK